MGVKGVKVKVRAGVEAKDPGGQVRAMVHPKLLKDHLMEHLRQDPLHLPEILV